MGMAQVQSRPSSNWSSSSAKRHDDYYRSSGNFRNPKTETLVQEQTLERGPWVRNSGSNFSSRKSVKSRSCYRNGESTDRARISGWEREPGEISSGGSDRDSPSEAVSSDFCRKRKSLPAGYIRDGSSKRAKFSPIQSGVGRNGSPKKRGDRLSPEREIPHEDALHGDGSSKKRAYVPSPELEVPEEVYSPRGYDPAGYIRDGSSKRAKFSPIQSEVGRNGSPKKRGDRLSPEREIPHEDALHGDGSSRKRAYMPSPELEVPQEVYSPRGYDPSHGIAGSRWASFESPLHEDETFQAETKRRRVSMEQNTSSSRSISRSPRVNVSTEGSKRRSASRSLSPEFQGNSVISQAEECEQRDISTNEQDMKRETENSSGSGCAIGEEHQDRPVDIDGVESTIDEAVGDDESSPVPAGVSRSFDMMRGCRSVDEFQKLNKVNEGTYGIVYKARDKKTGEIVALKKVKMEKQREGFPISALREVNILLSINHPCIVNVKEVVVGKDLDSIFMVMEFMEHDLKGFLEKHRKVNKKPLSTSQVKCLLLQLLEGLNHLHENWVLHRDLKTSNLLYNNKGELKICDLGLARQYGSPLRTYTETVVTLWYRAPELLLGAKKYSTAIDMWSVGCIMAELLSSKPLFDAKTEIEQVKKIYKILGKPNEKIWPDFTSLAGSKISFPRERFSYKLRDEFQAPFSGRPPLTESGMDLLSRCLMYDPKKRISCEEALNHPWFKEFPLPEAKEAMPALPPVNDHCRQPRQYLKSPCFLEAN